MFLKDNKTFSHLRILFFLLFLIRCCEGEQQTQEQQLLILQKLMNDNKLKFQKNIVPMESPSNRSSEEEYPREEYYPGLKLRHHALVRNESILDHLYGTPTSKQIEGNPQLEATTQTDSKPKKIPDNFRIDNPQIEGNVRYPHVTNTFEAEDSSFAEGKNDPLMIFTNNAEDNTGESPVDAFDDKAFSNIFDDLEYEQQFDYEDELSLFSDDVLGSQEESNETDIFPPESHFVSEIINHRDGEDIIENNGTAAIIKKNVKTKMNRGRFENKKDILGNKEKKRRHSVNKSSKNIWNRKQPHYSRVDNSLEEKKIKYFNRSGKYWHNSSNDVTSGGRTGSKKFVNDQSALYTKWSKWSRCSRHCQQTRRRRCRVPALCGTALIKEKRPCVGWRCQHEKFHLIKPGEITERYSQSIDRNKPSPKADVRVLLNYNSMFYTRWSEWASCSRTCLTSRYRSCRYSLFCGNAVIREEAYCYTQNSACEKWYLRHKLDSKYKNVVHETESNIAKVTVGDRQSIYNNNNRSDPQIAKGFHKDDDQIVFGHNKYISENALIPPNHNAQILNFQIGVSTHRFSPIKQSPISSNNVVSEGQNLKNDYYWSDKNSYKTSKNDKKFQTSNRFSIEKDPYSFKKPHYFSNYNPRKHSHKYWNSKDIPGASKYSSFSSLSLGRPNSLPKKCGVSRIKKPPWSLRIIGGREAPPDKWPWQVAILNRFKEVFCGGTLVAPQWIVTAAHCLRKRLYVRLAEHDLAIKEGPELEFKITETVSHPLYDSTTVDNDVALLRLPEPVEIGDKVAPVCIPEQGTPLPIGKECTIIGWGKERNTHFFGTDVLNEAEVPIINEETCRKVYDDYYITQNMFCAGYRRGRVDSCAGDSGGPLLCHLNGLWYIYGITSFGEGCGRKGKFGIYAKVSNYRTWINDVIGAHAHRDKSISGAPKLERNRRHHRRHAKYGPWFHRRSDSHYHKSNNSTRRHKMKFKNKNVT